MSLEQMFGKYIRNEFNHFDRVEKKLSNRSDTHAIRLLTMLTDIVSANSVIVEAGAVYFTGIDEAKLLMVITEQDVIDLLRCRVIFSYIKDCLAMRTDVFTYCNYIDIVDKENYDKFRTVIY